MVKKTKVLPRCSALDKKKRGIVMQYVSENSDMVSIRACIIFAFKRRTLRAFIKSEHTPNDNKEVNGNKKYECSEQAINKAKGVNEAKNDLFNT